MAIFKKRDSLTQNIAYMGIMTAINVIAVVLMTYVLPILFIPFVLIMPLTSTVVTFFCKKQYFPIYLFATLGICSLVTINNITDTLLYVLPSLICGFIFGVMIEYHFPSLTAIFTCALICTGLTYASIPLVELIYGQNMINVIATLFGLGEFQYLHFVVAPFILTISLIEQTLSFLIIQTELPKLGIEEEENDYYLLHISIGIVGSALSVIFYFIFPELCLFFLIFAVFFAVNEVFKEGVKVQKIPLILDGAFTIIFIIIFAIVFQYMTPPSSILLFNGLFDIYLLIALFNRLLDKNSKTKLEVKR